MNCTPDASGSSMTQCLQRGQGPLFSRTLVSAVGMSELGQKATCAGDRTTSGLPKNGHPANTAACPFRANMRLMHRGKFGDSIGYAMRMT